MNYVSPFVPMLPGESFVSWVSRFARVQCDMSAKEFVSFVSVPLQDLARTRDNAVERMHELTGISPDRLVQGGYMQLSLRYYKHRSEEFHSEFVAGNRVSYCPKCILHDISDEKRSFGMAVGRINWAFSAIRTCPKHSIPLVRERGEGPGTLFLDLAAHMPAVAQLTEMVDGAAPREVSGLQSYIENRFEGVEGPEWLDNQKIDLASRATEMLGACIEFGSSVNLSTLSQLDLDLAGRTGFEFTRRGLKGVREGLELIQSRASCSMIQAGPQGVFGVLYQWIQFKKYRKPVGPFREVFREHILDTMPIAVGVDLFGEPVRQRRRHSVVSLSQKFGVHPKTVQNALKMAGLLPSDFDPARDISAIEVLSAENLLKKIQRSIPVSSVPEYLGCGRHQVAQLIEAGILKPIAGRRDGRRSVTQGINAEDLNTFVDQLRAFGQCVSKPSQGMLGIVDASKSLKVHSVRIVELLLRQDLTKIELLDEELRYKSVLIDKNEVGRKLGVRSGLSGISISYTARVLGLPIGSIEALLRKSPDDMEPPLKICGQARHAGQVRDLVDPRSVESFKFRFQKLSVVSERMSMTVPAARKALSERGVFPVWDPKEVGAEFYWATDV